MSLFLTTFNKSSIYDMLFFNVKSVLEHPTLEDLKNNKPELFQRWKYISKIKYGVDFESGDSDLIRGTYEEKAIKLPEFTKIVCITYARVYSKDGGLKRDFKKITHLNEFDNIQIFMDVLHQISSDGMKSTPKYFPVLCGYNIIANDIPLLIKRHIHYRNKFETNKQIPYLLKLTLDSKPWESVVVDILNVWKFNGFDYAPLMLIAEHMGLKRTVDLIPDSELSKYYWKNIDDNQEETLDYITKQSINQTNLVIQFINEMRQL